MKWVLIFMSALLFSACQLFEDSAELQQKKHELALKKLEAEEKKLLAELETQKSLANVEKEKALALQELQNSIRQKELEANSEKELEMIAQKVALQESNNLLSFQTYLLAFLALLLIVVAVFVFYYFKRKREDEIRAYNDNLKKYFYFKENEARMKIAEKILETIAEGDLSKENEQKLINAFAQQEHDYDAEIVEQITYDDETNKA
jgi:predicted PurR-regulated permease PerM